MTFHLPDFDVDANLGVVLIYNLFGGLLFVVKSVARLVCVACLFVVWCVFVV